jgi:hypothetical protein
MPKFEVPYRIPFESGGAAAVQNLALNSTTTYIAIVFVAEATIDVKKAGFLASAAGAGGQNVNVTIETVNAGDGLPSGTAVVSTTTALPLTVGWNEVTFGTSGTLSAGTLYALKLQMAATPTTATSILYAYTNMEETFVPYFVNTGTRATNRVTEMFYLVDNAGGAKYYGWPFYAPTNQAVNSSLPEIGMKFNIPTTVCSTYKLLGVKFTGDPNAVTENVKIATYNWNGGNNSTALEDTEFSSFATANATNTAIIEYYFDTPQTLTAGSDYIVSIGTSNPASGNTPMTVRSLTVPDATKPALFDQTSGYTWDRVSRTSSTGSWTTTADSSLEIKLILDVASLPSGGGLLVHPGMTGGIRG